MPERVIHPNHRGAEAHDVERRKEAQRQRKYEFDSHFSGPLFRALPALGPRGFRVGSEGLADAGAEAIGLRQHRHQRSHVVHSGAGSEILEGLESGLAGP